MNFFNRLEQSIRAAGKHGEEFVIIGTRSAEEFAEDGVAAITRDAPDWLHEWLDEHQMAPFVQGGHVGVHDGDVFPNRTGMQPPTDQQEVDSLAKQIETQLAS